jgi:exosome complex RNA-binding protein Rrp42 (RNase PH superfamily)
LFESKAAIERIVQSFSKSLLHSSLVSKEKVGLFGKKSWSVWKKVCFISALSLLEK